MKNTIITCFFLFSLTSYAQTIDESWIKEHYTKKEIMIPMRDGVKLFTAIYAPKDNTEKHPILMNRTPYSCPPYGEDKINGTLYRAHWKEFLKENYIMVLQDVRGCFMSEGEFLDTRPFIANKKTNKDIDEASDAYDTVDWLIKNIDNNNGKVGVHGISYPGFYAAMAALSGHSAIKAVSPQAPVVDCFMGDDVHHNGAFMLRDIFDFESHFGVPRPKPRTVGAKGFVYYTNDTYKFFLETGAVKNFTKLLGDTFTFWKGITEHPNYDDWWKAQDIRNVCYDIKPAMLLVGGLFDEQNCYGAWNLYKAIEKQSPATSNKIVMGPWFHTQWNKNRHEKTCIGNVRFGSNTEEYFIQNITLPFFNYYLKGIGNIDSLAEATIFFSGENKWRKLTAFPTKETVSTPIYLNENSALSFTKPKAENKFTFYTSDPAKPVPYYEGVAKRTHEYMTDDQRFATSRTDVISFKSVKLENDMTLAGLITADLKVSITTTDADFIVKIIDVFSDKFEYDTVLYGKGNGIDYIMDGYQMLVRGEVMRGKFRDSFEKPEPFEPNKITTVKFDLPDVAHTFKKGHQIMIQIQSSWFPLVDRNPQTFIDIYQCDDKDFVKSDIKIYHDIENASCIILPVLK